MSTAAFIESAERPLLARRSGRGRAGRRPALITLRQAAREDCARIARLYMIASDGVAEYMWSRADEDDASLLEIGERRYAREGTSLSYQNCLVAENDGGVVGMMLSYPMHGWEGDGSAAPADTVLAPFTDLVDHGSLYVAALAMFHEHRGLGIGTRLLAEARRRARNLALDRLSLICFEKNTKALRLYERLGFRELRRRLIVPHPFLNYREGHAILLGCRSDELTID
jgi:ribosomal protein S18 acetylase RimI-like enzyme